MKAAITPRYGPPEVLEMRDVPMPHTGKRDVLVQIHATPVTAGDRRLRAADFPSISALPGRLMMGVLRPRAKVQGTMFAGQVVAVGSAVTRYAVGNDVFGSTDHGAYAEYLALPEHGAMAKMPAGLSYEVAAAVPYGAVTALRFLRDLGSVRRGDAVLIVGASGGVGRFAIQIATHLGAAVTAVCSAPSFELVRSLGAQRVVDYTSEGWARGDERYDVVFDIAGATRFHDIRPRLTETGRYLTLFVSLDVLLQMALTSATGGQKAKFGVAIAARRDMEELRDLLEQGVIDPVIADRFPFERIADAHRALEAGERHGAVMVTLA